MLIEENEKKDKRNWPTRPPSSTRRPSSSPRSSPATSSLKATRPRAKSSAPTRPRRPRDGLRMPQPGYGQQAPMAGNRPFREATRPSRGMRPSPGATSPRATSPKGTEHIPNSPQTARAPNGRGPTPLQVASCCSIAISPYPLKVTAVHNRTPAAA